MNNNGAQQWPEPTVLVFLRGHRELLPGAQEEFPVASAKPNETVEVSAEIATPHAPGRYTAFFRLADGERNMFGPRMWVDLMVPGESGAAASSDTVQDMGKSPKVSKTGNGSASKEDLKALKVAAKEEAKALKVAAKEVKKELKQVARDSKMAFTLAKKEIRAAKTNGNTSDEQVAGTAEEENKDDDFYDSGEGDQVKSQPVVPSVSVGATPSAAPVSISGLDDVTKVATSKFVSKWPIQMTALINMGFDNMGEEFIESLLDKHKGNVQTVCNWLLNELKD
jgi:hypothetical protein